MTDKSKINGLIFYFENSAELDPGMQETTLTVLNEYLNVIEEAEAAAKKKRQSPNKSGIYQINDNGEVICMYKTQNDALVALGKENKSGISDAVRGRVKTRKAYGYVWRFVDEYQAEHPGFKYTGPIYGEE